MRKGKIRTVPNFYPFLLVIPAKAGIQAFSRGSGNQEKKEPSPVLIPNFYILLPKLKIIGECDNLCPE